MRLKLFILSFFLPAMFCSAQTCRDEFKANPYLAGSNYVAYPGPKGGLSGAPAGYEPCYLSYSGQYGSSYLTGETYDAVYDMLQMADSLAVLTEQGKQLLEAAGQLRAEASGRYGELTELGAQQQREIAQRMQDNFPEIFNKAKARVDAKPTNGNRNVMSQDDPVISEAKNKGIKLLVNFAKEHVHPQRLMDILFTDRTFWKKNIDASKAMLDIFKLAMNVQGTQLRESINLCDLFTEEEIFDLWQYQNACLYVAYGPSCYSDGVQPYSQRNLLRKIINEADSCLRLDNCGANLRYGHDNMVMPLTCLLGLDDINKDITDLNTLATHEWCDYRISPMACNLQFVFYRTKGSRAGTSIKDARGGAILVKVLRNENEARLPIETDKYPYYKWSDVKDYYLKKLDAYDAAHPTVSSKRR